MILGYPEQSSVRPGETLAMHISTDAPAFRIDVVRQESAEVPVWNSDWLVGQFAPVPAQAGANLKWPGYDVPVPADWPTGVYLARFVEGDGNGGVNPQPTAPPAPPHPALVDLPDRFGAMLVVRPPPADVRASILYKVPLFTFHAYNSTANGNLYDLGGPVTLRRPGGGYGGYYRRPDKPDAYDQSSRRQTVEHWDMPFISWLYRNGYSCDFCTDLDLDRDASVIEGYRLLVGVGHDEYWTEPERQAVEAFIANGGNVAFFSGNTCWGKVAVIDSGDDTVLEGVGSPGWDPANPLTSEASLTGVTYLNGGGWWGGHRTDVPYVLYRTNNWVFEGTGLRDGDKLAPGSALVGYEADGAQYTMQVNVPVVNTAQGSPATLEILGIAQLLPIGQGDTDVAAGWDPGYGAPAGRVPRATMGLYTQAGRVFNAATTDWARVLAAGETQIGRITRNVLDSLAQVKQVEDVVAVAAYYAKSDAYQHVVAGTTGGVVREIYWAPQDPDRGGTGNGELTSFPAGSIVGVAGYYADGDQFQHVIVATTDGAVTEVFWQPGGPGVRQGQLTGLTPGDRSDPCESFSRP